MKNLIFILIFAIGMSCLSFYLVEKYSGWYFSIFLLGVGLSNLSLERDIRISNVPQLNRDRKLKEILKKKTWKGGTEKKCQSTHKHQKFYIYPNENKTMKVVSGVLTGWYEMEKGLPNKLKSDVFFMSDLLDILGYDTTKEDYYDMMAEFGQMI
jgi:hypothetical protein